MPVFSRGDKTIFFIHIPKSGGSSIERIGREFGWSESFSVRGKPLKDVAYYKATLQHLHADLLCRLFNLEEFDSIFTVVRNPFSRLKSEYYWQLSQGITKLDVEPWIYDSFNKYKDNHFIHDNHIRPQVAFLPKCNKLKIFKLEEDGVKKAKELFIKQSPGNSGFNFVSKVIFSILTKNKKEKYSVKNSKVEEKFQKHYDDIVKFYKEDYEKLSYQI